MKVIQTRTASSTPAKTGAPFFSKGGANDFFRSKPTEQPFFSPGKATAPVIQAKLTVGKPNDPYEKEADAMADMVVQRLAQPEPAVRKKEVPEKGGNKPTVQAKCNQCEQEEQLQKKPGPTENVLRKSIFESNEEKSVQRKPDVSPANKKVPAVSKGWAGIQAKGQGFEKEEKLQKKDQISPAPEKILRKSIFESNQEKNIQRNPDSAKATIKISTVKKGTAGIQAKCQECEQEEKLQKKDDNRLSPEKIQRKSIFESNEEPIQRRPATAPADQGKEKLAISDRGKGIQAKCDECEKEEKLQKKDTGEQRPEKLQLKPVSDLRDAKTAQLKAETIPLIPAKPVTSTPPAAPVVQAKCAACEQEEKLQEKEEDQGGDTGPVLQRKPLFEGSDGAGNLVQRSCRECEEGEKVFKKAADVQTAAFSAGEADGSRESIVAWARGEIGKVEAKKNDGTGKRIGADRLLEYFHIAAPGVWDDSIIETAGAKMPSWCGIFSVWAHKKAGKDIGNWQMGKGVSAFGTLTPTDDPQPGDIGYIDQPFQHHAIVERVEGDTIHTIDGNSGTYSEVIERQKPRSVYTGFLTAFGGVGSESVQKKEDKSEGLVQTKTGDTVASPSIEQQLTASKGGGSPLPEAARSGIEQSMGADFSNVKIHTDSSAVQMSKDLHAQAFTHGSDIYFNSGKYDTASSGGKHLLAHELTHVVQQGSAPAPVLNRAAVSGEPETSYGEEGANLSPEEIEEQAQKDLAADDFGGPAELPGEEADSANSGGGPSNTEGTGEIDEGDSEVSEDEEADQAVEELEEDLSAEEDAEGGGDTVPDNTPTKSSTEGSCPQIVPDFPEPPENSTLPPTQDESFYEDLLDIMTENSLIPGGFLISGLGVAAYHVWRRLPMSVKIRVINFVLDQAIAGAYLGRHSKHIDIANSKLLSAVMLGFFKRIRALPDAQKVYMFEKFGKLIIKGDSGFSLGLLQGLLMGFFLDGLLSIVQMVIDLICIVPKILDFFKTIKDFLSQIPYEIGLILNSIQEFLASLGDFFSNAWSELLALIRDPKRVLLIFQRLEEASLGVAEKIGAAMADGMIRYAPLPTSKLGQVVGRIGGMLLFEGLLIYFTAGGGAAVTAAKNALRVAAKALATIGKYIFKIVKVLGRVLRFIRNVITRILKFLTPLLKAAMQVARRVIDRLSGLFKMFRRYCRPGSVKCNLPKPNCKGRYVPRLGGFLPHDRYIRRTTGTTRDYRLRGTVFGLPVPCNYDAKKGRLLIEGKTGYHYLPFIQRTKPSLYRMIMFRFNEQRWRCMAIAARCLHPYVWYMQSGPAAAFLNSRWHGAPPVLHVP